MKRRNTQAKQHIRELLESADSALSQDIIEQKMNGAIDRVTIYRVLNSFCEDGIIHKVISDDGKAYYALCNSCKPDNHSHEHAHFRCLNCRKVECLHTNVIVKQPDGYVFRNFNYWISGYCNACK